MIEKPYLLFIGDVPDDLAAKTAAGIVEWRRDWCVGQLRLDGCKVDLGLPDMTISDASAAGAKTMVENTSGNKNFSGAENRGQ